MSESISILLGKLEKFIRRYYKNQIIRGVILGLSIILATYLLVVSLEYFGGFGTLTRGILFFILVFSLVSVITWFIIIPLLKLMRIGRRLSEDQAAVIIGRFFPEINDKLLNTLQLIRQAGNDKENVDLLVAGIEQKIRQIRIIDFSAVINLKINFRYLRYAAAPMILLLLVVIVSPRMISEPTSRIIHYSREYDRSAFQIELLNKDFSVLQQEDFLLRVRATGEKIPAELFVEYEGQIYKMKNEPPAGYSYLFKTLQKSVFFRITAGNWRSGEYEIRVYPKPIILNFEVFLEYPAYTKKKNEKIGNTGDLIVPEGTRVTWSFFTRDVEKLEFLLDNKLVQPEKEGNNRFNLTERITEPMAYTIIPVNHYTSRTDSLHYRVTAIKDSYPVITVDELIDTSLVSQLFFRGIITDDYGFTKLTFNYILTNSDDTTRKIIRTENIPLDLSVNKQQFFYSIDLQSINQQPGDNFSYYFEVWDNDQVNGPKSTRTEPRVYRTPTKEEISKKTDENAKDITNSLEKSLSDTRSMKKNVDALNRKLVEQNNISFQEKKQVEDILKANERITDKIEEIKKKSDENLRNEENMLQLSPDLLEKQKKLKEMMDQLMTDDLKKMIQEMKDLMNQADKQKMAEMLEKIKMTSKDLEQQIDRSLELFKQIEFEKKLEDLIKDLKDNAEKQSDLAKKNEEKKEDLEKLAEQQQKVNDQYDSLKNQLDELKKQNDSLSSPYSFKDQRRLQDSLSKNLDQSLKKLNSGDQKDAVKNQKDASRQMKNMADQLQIMQDESEMDQMAEDEGNMRQILENLIRVSFEQEDLMKETRVINRNDPRYLEILTRQKELGDKMKVVEDSMSMVAKRQVLIQQIIMKEISEINRNNKETIETLESRDISNALTHQQLVMTAVNNLAILVDEALNQMEDKMQNMSMGQGMKMCRKPKPGGKMSAKTLKELQQQMNQQLNQMKKNMENTSQNPNQPGQKGKMSEQLARLAAEQEAIRNELKKYQESLLEEGIKNTGDLSKAMGEMEETEKDLVNKRITQETLLRQQQILTRLLESEKAELVREKEEERESREGKNIKRSNPNPDFEYKEMNKTQSDILKLDPLPVNYFYKSKINSYLIRLER